MAKFFLPGDRIQWDQGYGWDRPASGTVVRRHENNAGYVVTNYKGDRPLPPWVGDLVILTPGRSAPMPTNRPQPVAGPFSPPTPGLKPVAGLNDLSPIGTPPVPGRKPTAIPIGAGGQSQAQAEPEPVPASSWLILILIAAGVAYAATA